MLNVSPLVLQIDLSSAGVEVEMTIVQDGSPLADAVSGDAFFKITGQD